MCCVERDSVRVLCNDLFRTRASRQWRSCFGPIPSQSGKKIMHNWRNFSTIFYWHLYFKLLTESSRNGLRRTLDKHEKFSPAKAEIKFKFWVYVCLIKNIYTIKSSVCFLLLQILKLLTANKAHIWSKFSLRICLHWGKILMFVLAEHQNGTSHHHAQNLTIEE